MATYATKASDIARVWYIIDADGQILGRLASEVAALLRGKHKPNYVPYLDVGDHVVVVNLASTEPPPERPVMPMRVASTSGREHK